MAVIERSTGVIVETPRGYEVPDETRPSARRRNVQAVPTGTANRGVGAILGALTRHDMELVDSIPLRATSTSAQTRRPPAGTTRSARVNVDVAASEHAVLLVEQDGVYSWSFPLPATAGARGTRSLAARGPRRLTFDIPLYGQTRTRAGSRRGLGDLVGMIPVSKATAFVLKFTVGAVLGATVAFLERKVHRGFIHIDSSDPAKWRPVDGSTLNMPTDRAPRVLLLIHGCFSSTAGGFGALGGSSWGVSFLAAALQQYDAIIGFDHATLSDDPLVNATDLLRRLQSINVAAPPTIDVIAHSRGGLVFRSLVENVMPSVKDWRANFSRAVFVGCTNGGTHLAEPANWRSFIDLYTNLAIGAAKAVSLVQPQTALAMTVGSGLVEGLATFAKSIAVEAITANGIPGIAAMEPNGPFVRTINQTQVGQPSPGDCLYYAVTSDFESGGLLKGGGLSELPDRFLAVLTNGLADRIIGTANDLIVDKAAMTEIDPTPGGFIKDVRDFGKNHLVYHTNYFTRPEVANDLTRWLKLFPVIDKGRRNVRPSANGAAKIASPKTRRGRAEGGAPTALSLPPDFVPAGTAVRDDVPAMIDTDVLVADGAAPVGAMLDAIDRAAPSYVVVKSRRRGRKVAHALKTEEAITHIGRAHRDERLDDALTLADWEPSALRGVRSLQGSTFASRGRPTTTSRAVALDGDRVVGVFAGAPDALDTRALARFEATMTRSTGGTKPRVGRRPVPSRSNAALKRRIMPSFRPPPPDRPPKVATNIRAEMPLTVAIRAVVNVDVRVSREALSATFGMASAGATIKVDKARRIMIRVVPKSQFETAGSSEWIVDPPASGQLLEHSFPVRGLRVGEGVVRIEAMQGQALLTVLELRPRIAKAVRNKTVMTITKTASPGEPRPAEPLDRLWITQMQRGDGVVYQFLMDGPALDPSRSDESALIRKTPSAHVSALYDQIESFWSSTKDDAAAFTGKLRAFGGDLWDDLVPPLVQRRIWDNRDKIKSIVIRSDEPFIPWELVHLKDPNKRTLPEETIFLGQLGMVRWPHDCDYLTDDIVVHKRAARTIIPNYPPPYTLAATSEEFAFLKDKFSARPVTPQLLDVQQLLQAPNSFDLLHFAGHGAATVDDIDTASIFMEGRLETDASGQETWTRPTLSASEVRQGARFAGRRPFIVLNACQVGRAGYDLRGIGGFASAFIGAGAGAFVSSLWSVGDQPARRFVESFYTQLLRGKTIAHATTVGREEAREGGDATWLAYAVYAHPNARLRIQ